MRAADIRPGDRLVRLDTGEHVYTVEQVNRVRVHNPEHGAELDYVQALCRHTDQVVRPHYWRPGDWAPLTRQE